MVNLTGHIYLEAAIVLWMFYIGFVLYAGCQNAIKERRWLVILPCFPILLIAGAIDVVINQTFARLLFLEFKGTWTFSQRLDYHFRDVGWRGDLARSIGHAIDSILPGHIR